MAVIAAVKEFYGSVKGIITNSAGKEVDVQGEDDGTIKTVLYGKDSDANQDPLRTNTKQQLQVEVVGGGIAGGNTNSSVLTLFSLIMLEMKLTNLHLSKISGLTEATICDVEEP